MCLSALGVLLDDDIDTGSRFVYSLYISQKSEALDLQELHSLLVPVPKLQRNSWPMFAERLGYELLRLSQFGVPIPKQLILSDLSGSSPNPQLKYEKAL